MTQGFHPILPADEAGRVGAIIERCNLDLIDLSLQLKQAHWNIRGARFQSLHEQLDTIVAQVRLASDELAERIVTLGLPADGSAAAVARESRLEPLPGGFLGDARVVEVISKALFATIDGLREAIGSTAELDPVSEDLLIGICGPLEKQLWMLQSQQL
jgi:starvation-inducible DNA-binding protein